MISLILEKCPAMEKFRDILFDLRKKNYAAQGKKIEIWTYFSQFFLKISHISLKNVNLFTEIPFYPVLD
jgi:hypothetical protein